MTSSLVNMSSSLVNLRGELLDRVDDLGEAQQLGLVRQVKGVIVRALMQEARVGDVCILRNPSGSEVLAEVVGIEDSDAILSPYASLDGISTITRVLPQRKPLSVAVGQYLFGNCVDAFGTAPGLKPSPDSVQVPAKNTPPPPMSRQLVREIFTTGIRAIDGMLTVGAGQRVGIFGGAGLGKSTLVSMLVNHSKFDICVVGLIGERGREIREFWDAQITPETKLKTILVASTSDRPAVERRLAANTATAIAEGFRDAGFNVMLVIDSLTRLARAQREIGLAAGEPPVRRGYPPSMATALAELLERAGPGERGSITAFYTVLVEGEIDEDPVAEEVKALLDGHIILNRKLSEEGHFPAIDVVMSRSRLMTNVVPRAHARAADRVRALLAKYRDLELLLQIGEYQPGSDAIADEATAKIDEIRAFLRQEEDEPQVFDETSAEIHRLAARG
jgi:ATP synthase in type III secretion protein N